MSSGYPHKAGIIGIDCACDPEKVGLARAVVINGTCSLQDVQLGKTEPRLEELITDWLQDGVPTLLAMDAPLGWPAAMGKDLELHEAGEEIREVDPNKFFRRSSDHRSGMNPLDVGANLIARTAHKTLRRLAKLRKTRNLPLAWKPGPLRESQVIEVYPAGTLQAHGWSNRGYKKGPKARERRDEIADFPEDQIHIEPHDLEKIVTSDDQLDAVICVLAGWDFLQDYVEPPHNLAIAQKEGFIWVYDGRNGPPPSQGVAES